MWLQNNVQEKDKKMYPFTSALGCIWEAVDGDKGKQNVREIEDSNNYIAILQGQKSVQ